MVKTWGTSRGQPINNPAGGQDYVLNGHVMGHLHPGWIPIGERDVTEEELETGSYETRDPYLPYQDIRIVEGTIVTNADMVDNGNGGVGLTEIGTTIAVGLILGRARLARTVMTGVFRSLRQFGPLTGIVRIPAQMWSRLTTAQKVAIGGAGAATLAVAPNIDMAELDAGFIDIGELFSGVSEMIGFGNGIVENLPDRYEASLLAALGLGDQNGQVVKTWNTNPENPSQGTWMVRLADGRGAALKKNGVWTIFRYRKPIMLYAGKIDVKQLLKAERVVATQSKRLRKMMDKYAPRRRPAERIRVIDTANGKDVINIKT